MNYRIIIIIGLALFSPFASFADGSKILCDATLDGDSFLKFQFQYDKLIPSATLTPLNGESTIPVVLLDETTACGVKMPLPLKEIPGFTLNSSSIPSSDPGIGQGLSFKSPDGSIKGAMNISSYTDQSGASVSFGSWNCSTPTYVAGPFTLQHCQLKN